MADFRCGHRRTIQDDEDYALCERCGAAFYDGPLREQDFLDAAARIAGYETWVMWQLDREALKGDRDA